MYTPEDQKIIDSGCFSFFLAVLVSIAIVFNLLGLVIMPGIACDLPEIKTKACEEFHQSWYGKLWNKNMDFYRESR